MDQKTMKRLGKRLERASDEIQEILLEFVGGESVDKERYMRMQEESKNTDNIEAEHCFFRALLELDYLVNSKLQ